MEESNTPGAVMYSWLKSFGHITKIQAVRILFDENARICGGRSISDLVASPSYLTRNVINSSPGDFPIKCFKDFQFSTQDIVSMMLGELPKKTGKRAITDTFSGPASQEMLESLEVLSLDSERYRNTVSFIMKTDLPAEGDRATLLVMLFVITGCIGDSAYASSYVRKFSSKMLSSGFQTMTTEPGTNYNNAADAADDIRLALWRVNGKHMEGDPHRLSADPEGTVIDSLPDGANTITDVGENVSKNHLRIWRDDDNHWFAQGLGSTNGTTLISGADQSLVNVELPRAERKSDVDAGVPEPVELLPGDTLCLAGTTGRLPRAQASRPFELGARWLDISASRDANSTGWKLTAKQISIGFCMRSTAFKHAVPLMGHLYPSHLVSSAIMDSPLAGFGRIPLRDHKDVE